ncbi:MAG TPA: GH92 family glycosyl hydrolase [Kofleriaceae bacterium]
MQRAVVVILLAACGASASPPLPEVTDATAYVDPRIGTGGLGYAYGSCFVGAAAPHGFAKPGPDTDGPFGTASFQHFSGYYADDDRIQGFSSVHLHGAGATDYGVLSVMPTLAFDPSKTSVVDYEDGFAKADELVSAGNYTVTLASGIEVELTATPRVAVERYTFPSAGTIVIDLTKTLSGGTVDAATIAVDDAAHEVTGQLHHLGGMSKGFGGYTIYFVARAAAAWTSSTTWTNGAALAVPAGAATLAIGMSLVSAAGARANLAAEVPAIDFDAVASQTRAAWAQQLGVVKLTGGTEVERRTFYTSFYHAFLMPSVIGDVDGSYVLAGQTQPQVAAGWSQMSDLSLWDSYRTVASLYAWLDPQSAHDTARSLVAFATGLGAYPKWPLAIGETGTMLGASAEIVIADATARGVPDAGGADAYPMLRDAAMNASAPPTELGGRDQVGAYMQYGFVPRSVDRSVSLTTEYAHDDFALAQLAGALGESADHDALLARSHGWAMLYDPAVGFLRGRNSDGSFPTDAYDPTDFSDGDYAEADGWQSLWMTGNHDSDTLAATLGGAGAATGVLESMFEMAKQDWDTADPSAANFPRPYYWAGNEPDLDAVFVFWQLGDARHGAQWLRWIEDTMYSDQPDGVPGNDDGGTMGSWYVLATLGLYPIAGSDQWILGAPRFPSARVDVGSHELVIEVKGSGQDVKSVELDGAAVDGPTISQAQLAAASTLTFVMSN